MKRVINAVRRGLLGEKGLGEVPEEFLEVASSRLRPEYSIRTFSLKEYDNLKVILKVLRTAKVIALIDVKPLKEKDMIDLKRAINKLKAITAEIGGEIVGLTGDWLVITPHTVSFYKPVPKKEAEEDYY
ncbi:MAG: cell division protein SepF [Candidatus Woesearchaeota archaeon]